MSNCHHVTLARNGIAHVQQCTKCGCVSVHLGATTVRFDAGALEALSAVLGEAAATIHAEQTIQIFATQKGVA